MKFLKYGLMLSAALLVFSCAHNNSNHACCGPKGPQVCKDGQCKKDKSCCENSCKSCTGDAKSCSTGQCDLKKKA
jgi:hypothetical protein